MLEVLEEVELRQGFEMERPEHEWIDDNHVKIRLPKALLVLTKDEYVRALKRGKGFLRSQKRHEAIERGKAWQGQIG